MGSLRMWTRLREQAVPHLSVFPLLPPNVTIRVPVTIPCCFPTRSDCARSGHWGCLKAF